MTAALLPVLDHQVLVVTRTVSRELWERDRARTERVLREEWTAAATASAWPLIVAGPHLTWDAAWITDTPLGVAAVAASALMGGQRPPRRAPDLYLIRLTGVVVRDA